MIDDVKRYINDYWLIKPSVIHVSPCYRDSRVGLLRVSLNTDYGCNDDTVQSISFNQAKEYIYRMLDFSEKEYPLHTSFKRNGYLSVGDSGYRIFLILDPNIHNNFLVVGVVVFLFDPTKDIWFVDWMWVHPFLRGKGLRDPYLHIPHLYQTNGEWLFSRWVHPVMKDVFLRNIV